MGPGGFAGAGAGAMGPGGFAGVGSGAMGPDGFAGPVAARWGRVGSPGRGGGMEPDRGSSYAAAAAVGAMDKIRINFHELRAARAPESRVRMMRFIYIANRYAISMPSEVARLEVMK